MTNGATASGGDVAPAQSPAQVVGLAITPGQLLLFSTVGTVANRTNRTMFGAEGNTNNVLAHQAGAENGISSCTAPIDSLLGVFLGPGLPSLTTAPTNLDFGTQAARDYTRLAPALKQVFFVGDGHTTAGMTQTVIVPLGATRLFLGPMDGFTWFDNAGAFTVNVIAQPRLTIQALGHSAIAISWPTNAMTFSLESSMNLAGSAWVATTNARVVTGSRFVSTFAPPLKQQFFRLRTP